MRVQTEHKSARATITPGQSRAGERGAALITALLFMVLLTALGLATVMTSSTEILTSSNDRLNKLALDHANAGLQMALAALEANHLGYSGKRGFQLSSIDPDADYGTWSLNNTGYTTVDATPRVITTNQGDNYYSVAIEFKKEDAVHNRDGSPDNQVVTYSKDCGYPKAPIQNWRKAFPVYLVTSTGYVKSKPGDPDSEALATAVVTTEITKNTINVEFDGAVNSIGCIDLGGNLHINGTTTCPDDDDKSSYVTACGDGISSGTDNNAAGSILPAGSHQESADPWTTESILGFSLEDLKSLAQGNGTYYSTAATGETAIDNNDFNYDNDLDGNPDFDSIVYIDSQGTEVNIAGVSNNYGILIIDGDARIQGTIVWNGIVYITGNFTAGAGTLTINGGLMVDGTCSLTGTVTINYDCAAIRSISDVAFNSKMLNWERTYVTEY